MPQAQIEVAEVFRPLFRPARYKGAHGGRGSGKSHFFATAVLLECAQAPKRVVCIREIQRSIKDSVKQLLEDKIADLGLGSFFEVLDAEIRGRNGSLIIFRGMQNHTADSIKSLEGFNIAWVEEAQTISQRSLDLLIPTIREPGSELWFSWNPRKATDPVDVLLRVDPPEGAIVIEANCSDNPWFPDELRADMERDRDRDPDKYRHVWLGGYEERSEKRVFRNWRVAALDPPADVVWHYGADWGFAVDPTAALRCAVWGDTLYIDHEVYEVGCAIERTPALLAQLPDAQKWVMRADSARPETIDYVYRHGFRRLAAARKGKGSVEHGIAFLQGFDIVVHPRCLNTIRELGLYSYKEDRQTGEILPVVEDAHNHLMDALRYAVEGLHRRGIALSKRDAAPRVSRRNDYGFRPDREAEGDWRTI